LKALTVMTKRQPGAQIFVSQNDACPLEHLFDSNRQGI